MTQQAVTLAIPATYLAVWHVQYRKDEPEPWLAVAMGRQVGSHASDSLSGLLADMRAVVTDRELAQLWALRTEALAPPPPDMPEGVPV